MNRSQWLLFLLTILLLASCQRRALNRANQSSPDKPASAPELQLHRALPVDGPAGAEPSGLTIKDGFLYTVSDKDDSTIFRLTLGEENVVMSPWLHFSSPPAGGNLDLEGITCDSAAFYVVSEKQFQILRVMEDSRKSNWASPFLEPLGKEVGLFQKSNAYFEGIALTGKDQFVLAAERQPRGLMEVNTGFDTPSITSFILDSSIFPFKEGISSDFSGLFSYNGKLYVLQRNAYLFSEMLRDTAGYREGKGWSYGKTAHAKQYNYTDMKYGHAEGLAIDDRYIYVILDNNNDPRLSDNADRRPLLFIFLNPGL